jgi:hypothetical protein
LNRAVSAASPKKAKQSDRFRTLADRYRNHPAIRQVVYRFLALLGASLVTGMIVVACERPEYLALNSASNGRGIEVMQVIAQAKASRGADIAVLTEAQINDYLRLRAGPKGFFAGDWCRFDGVQLTFRPGVCYASTRYVLFGLEFYLSGTYRAGEDAGRPTFKNRGGAIGRLPVAPILMTIGQQLFFGELWQGLVPERETINRFGRVEFGQATVTLVPQ